MPKGERLVPQDAGQEEPGISPQKQNVLREIDELAVVWKAPFAHGPFEDGEQESRRDRFAPAAHAECEQCSAQDGAQDGKREAHGGVTTLFSRLRTTARSTAVTK